LAKMILNFIQLILGILLITTILLQGRSGGIAGGWSGKSFQSKRGIERTFFFLTIVLTIFFLISSILILLVA